MAERPGDAALSPRDRAVLGSTLGVVDLGVAVIGADGTVRFANDALRALLGDVDLVEGAREPDLTGRIAVHEGEAAVGSLSGSGDGERVWRYWRDDRTLCWLQLRAAPVHDAELGAIVVTVADITVAREARDARNGAIAVQRQLTRQLEAANAQLAETNAQLERFAGALAHDLKAPLANIASFAELLPRLLEEGGPAARDLPMVAARITANAQRASAMVSDLLDYARTVGEAFERVPVLLADVVTWVQATLEEDLGRVGGTVEVTDLPAVVANEAAIRQVFLNLVANSVKYRRPEVAPVIRIEAGPDPLDAAMVAVRVVDNGRGIPAERREDVFDLGTRLLDADAPVDGSGLGLASSRVVVEAHGGHIRVAGDAEGGGTVFELTLPREHVVDRALPGGTVMVIDDDPDVSAVVRLSGRRLGLEVVAEVVDGTRALDVYDALDERPSVVVLDLTLPGTDGLRVAEALRLRSPEQRIVLHSSHIDDAVRAVAADLGIDACVPKGSTDGILDALAAVLPAGPGDAEPDGRRDPVPQA